MSYLPHVADSLEPTLLPPSLVVAGPGGKVEAHAHHGMHVVIARAGRLRADIVQEARTTAVDAAGIWIAPDVRHRIDATDLEVAMLFVDPESREGRALRRGADPFRLLEDEVRDGLSKAWPHSPGARRDEVFATSVFAALGITRDAPTVPVHPGVMRVLRYMREGDRPPALADLAAVAGLSPGRLLHVFTDAVGIPPRRYLLWLKVQRASRAMASGQSITDAAHAA
ncbi:MAG TPA: AraC family transcriptional regulator, partial [Vulgatibacter sp.]